MRPGRTRSGAVSSSPQDSANRACALASSPDARYRVGHFVSVWKKDPATGIWHVLFDGGGPAPVAVEISAAAEKVLAQAPRSCPSQ